VKSICSVVRSPFVSAVLAAFGVNIALEITNSLIDTVPSLVVISQSKIYASSELFIATF
jgi:hypothetical protein